MPDDFTQRTEALRQGRPTGLPSMAQHWADLLFLHWRADPAEIRRRIPAGLTLDTFGGEAHVGLVAFAMRGVRPWLLPPLPWLSNFLELNVRVYVRGPDGTPGVHFLSLDCERDLAVRIAQAAFHLPYCHATMRWDSLPVAWDGFGVRGSPVHAMASPGVSVRCWGLRPA